MVTFGILGFGRHAVKRLVPGFTRARKAGLMALSRRDLARAQASAREFHVALAFDSAEALCRAPEVEAIFVATPNACHLENVLLALECGKPVLCEKPMGTDAAQCRAMVEAAHRTRRLLGMAQIFRFAVSVNRLRERVQGGQIGKVIFARAEFGVPTQGHTRPWLYDKRLSGGGPIADVGVHCIDTLRFILADEVARVHALGFSDERSGEVEAAAALNLEFRSRTLASVLVSFRSGYRTPLEFVGEKGVLRARDGLSVERPVTLELCRDGRVVESEAVSNHNAHSRQLDAFAAAIEGTTPYPVPGEEGWRNQLVLDAAYRSLASGRTEAVPSLPALAQQSNPLSS